MKAGWLGLMLVGVVSVGVLAQIVVPSPDGQPVIVSTYPAPPACQPAAGTAFPVGITSVLCPSSSFTVTVIYTPPLLQPSNFVLEGMFRVPSVIAGGTFEYAGQGLGYLPAHDSLFVTGRRNDATMTTGQKVAEISSPTPVLATSLSALPTATVLQPFKEPTEGKFLQAAIPGTPTFIGDYLPVGDELVFTEYAYYDVAGGTGGQQKALFARPLDLSVSGQVTGPFGVVSTPPVASGVPLNPMRFANVYLFDIPPAWQAAFGGPHALGATPANGNANASNGASVFATDFRTFTDPQPMAPLQYYPANHPLGPPVSAGVVNDLWNATAGSGVSCVIPDGSQSLFCAATIGVGPYCYGNGTTQQPPPAGYCYDPANATRGTHAFPYQQRAWLWDLSVLQAVKNGTATPWAAVPYANWPLTLPLASSAAPILGTAYDAGHQRVLLTVSQADGTRPLVYVLKVTQ